MTTRAKIVDLRTERRKVNSRKAQEKRLALLNEEIAKDLIEVCRLCAEDPKVSAQLIEGLSIGGDA